MIRTKFLCTSVTKSMNWNSNRDQFPFLYTYRFQVVNGNTDENKVFFASTPTGTVEIGALNAELFEPNKEYFLDFTPAQ